jgi:hypothetical protein
LRLQVAGAGSLPEGEISFGEMSNDDRYVRVIVSSDVDPGTVYLVAIRAAVAVSRYDSSGLR